MKLAQVLVKRFKGSQASDAVFAGMSRLAGGAGGAKIIGLLSMPVLSRLYSPEEFGSFSVFTALVIVLSPLATMRYVVAIPLVKSHSLGSVVALSCTVMAAVFCLLLTIAAFLAGPAVLQLVGAESLVSIWWVVPLGVLLAALYEIANHWSMRYGRYGLIGRVQVLQELSGLFVQVGLSLVSLSSYGLIAGRLARSLVGVKPLAAGLRLNKITIKKMLLVLQRYSDLPKYRLPTQLLFVVAAQMPVVFFSAKFGVDAAGQLGMSMMAVAIPVTVLATTTKKAYFAEIAKTARSSGASIRVITEDVILRQLLIAIPIAIGIGLFAPVVFHIAFGHNWSLAGNLARYLSVALVFQFLYTSVSDVFAVKQKLKTQLYNQVARLLLVLLSFVVAHITKVGPEGAIALYALFLAASYIWGLFQVVRLIRN